jgi:hypothetical protein
MHLKKLSKQWHWLKIKQREGFGFFKTILQQLALSQGGPVNILISNNVFCKKVKTDIQ